jgi:hypothetical protein
MSVNCAAPADAVAVLAGAAVADGWVAELDVAGAVGDALLLADVPEPPQAASPPARAAAKAAATTACAGLALLAKPAEFLFWCGRHF